MFDIHCHILPGVDDGSDDLAESRAMLMAARNAGISRIVCTPHCRSSRFNYNLIVERYQLLSGHAQACGIQLDLGFEVFWAKLTELGMEYAHDLCIQGSNLMLLEFSTDSLPPNWQRIIYALQAEGIQPIIAHPERYRPVQKNLDVAYEMKEMGCLLQLSANFVDGGFRSHSKRVSMELLREGLVDYLASDAHCVEDYALYRKALQTAQRL